MPEHINDKGYKRILSVKKNFLSLLKGFVKEPWVCEINEDDLELINKRFVLKDFSEREADIIYKLNFKGKTVIFYILLELQSSVDYTMPFRLLVYMTELMRMIFMDTPKEIRELSAHRLPCVIPIVLYNGTDTWTAKKSFREYLSGHESFGGYVIDFNYIFIDVNNLDKDYLAEIGNLISAVFLLDKKILSQEDLTKNLQTAFLLFKSLSQDEQNTFINWLKDVLPKKRGVNRYIVTETIGELERERERSGYNMTYAIERFFDEVEEKGIEKGKKEGIKEGIKKGMEKAALKMLKKNKDIDEIHEITDLPIDRILSLKEELHAAV